MRVANIAFGTSFLRGSRRMAGYLAPVRVPLPTRLLIAPQDLRSSDGTIALDIFAGRLTFAGRHIETGGRSPFDVTPPSYAFAEELHGFGWLRHARATESPAMRDKARILVADWIDLYGRSSKGFAMRTSVLVRRIISWTTQSPLLLEGADESFYRLFIKSLHKQATILLRECRVGVPPLSHIPALLALSYFALCTDRTEKLAATVLRELAAAIEAEILPDGGHVSRNPQIIIDILLDLLPLQQAYAARNLKIVAEIPAAVTRMTEMLRMLRHGDGSLALFNGMGNTEASELATLLAYGNRKSQIQHDASYSGYQRVDLGGTCVLVDAGRSPPSRWSVGAHAGCLSLELSARGARIFVNCGSPRPGQDMARQLSRATAAHSTLTIGDTSSCRFVVGKHARKILDLRVVSGPRQVTYGRESSDGGEVLVARHDGYANAFGLIHQRSIWLGDKGNRLEGQDILLAQEGRPAPKQKQAAEAPVSFALRFHLHPNVKAQLSDTENLIIIEAGAGDVWHFEAGGAPLTLEDSIFFATRQGQQRIRQIVILGIATPGATTDWSLTNISATKA